MLPEEFSGVGGLEVGPATGGTAAAAATIQQRYWARRVTLSGHARHVLGLEFCHSSTHGGGRARPLVATSCRAYVVKVWDYERGECLFTLRDAFQGQVLSPTLSFGVLFATSRTVPARLNKKATPTSLPSDKIFAFDCGIASSTSITASAKVEESPGFASAELVAQLPNPRGAVVDAMAAAPTTPTLVVSYSNGAVYVYSFCPTSSTPSGSTSAAPLSVAHRHHVVFTGTTIYSIKFDRMGAGFFAACSPWLYWTNLGPSTCSSLEACPTTTTTSRSAVPSVADRGETMKCAHCGLFRGHSASKKCGGCGCVRFCDSECLRAAWKGHKAECKATAATAKARADRARSDEPSS